MEIDKLAESLLLSASPNENERKIGEAYFKNARVLPQFAQNLLTICCNENISNNIQLNASIQLKNYVSNFWKFGPNGEINKSLILYKSDEVIVISEEDKQFVRDNIISLISISRNLPIKFGEFNSCSAVILENKCTIFLPRR